MADPQGHRPWGVRGETAAPGRSVTSSSSGCRPTRPTCRFCVRRPLAWPRGWTSPWTRSRTCASPSTRRAPCSFLMSSTRHAHLHLRDARGRLEDHRGRTDARRPRARTRHVRLDRPHRSGGRGRVGHRRRRTRDRAPAQAARRRGVTTGDPTVTEVPHADDVTTYAREPGRSTRPSQALFRGWPADPSTTRGARRPRRAAPAAGRAPGPALPQPRRAVRRPDPGRHHRADQVRRPLRPRARRGVLHLRDPHDRRRDQAALPRQGLGGPRTAPAAGAAAHAHHGDQRALPALRPRADRRGAGRAAGHHRGGGARGPGVGQRLQHRLARRARPGRRRRGPARRRHARRSTTRRWRASSTASRSSRCWSSSRRARSGSCCCGSSAT